MIYYPKILLQSHEQSSSIVILCKGKDWNGIVMGKIFGVRCWQNLCISLSYFMFILCQQHDMIMCMQGRLCMMFGVKVCVYYTIIFNIQLLLLVCMSYHVISYLYYCLTYHTSLFLMYSWCPVMSCNDVFSHLSYHLIALNNEVMLHLTVSNEYTIYYLSNDGRDIDGCWSKTQPCLTGQSKLSYMKDTSSEIVYRSGTYTSTFDSITLSSYVTLKLHWERV